MTFNRRRFVKTAGATAAASALPLWGFRMSAPQYPGESLHLRVTTSGIAGDVQEVSTLQKYIGVRFPRHLPELGWLSATLPILALVLAACALAGQTRSGKAACALALGALVLLLAGSAAALQARLYEVGHDRDPSAPIRAIRDFTPPVVGPKKVGNFTVWSYPHLGGLSLALAGVLVFLSARQAFRRVDDRAGTTRAPTTPAGRPSNVAASRYTSGRKVSMAYCHAAASSR